MMGQVARLHLAPAGVDGRKTAVAKLPAAHRGNRGQAELLGLYEREILFYRELAGRVGYRTPELLGAALRPGPKPDPDAGEQLGRLPDWLIRILTRLGLFLAGRLGRPSVLVLEDLAPAVPADQLGGLDDGRLEQVVRAVARAHAASWNAPALQELSWLPAVDSAPALLGAMYRLARRPRIRALGPQVPAEILELADAANARVAALTRALAGPPWTLLHGDLRVDNLFLAGPAPEDVIFTDWQVPARGRGVYDLAYFLCGILEPTVTAREEDRWVDLYHRELQDAGVRDYDRSVCHTDYLRAMLQMLPRVLTASASVDFTNARGAALQERWLERLIGRARARASQEWQIVLGALPDLPAAT